MVTHFEFVKRFADAGLELPKRGTANSAGYDLTVAEDIIIPRYEDYGTILLSAWAKNDNKDEEYINRMLTGIANAPIVSLQELAALTKQTKAKPTLVSTGVKCYLQDNQYLELSVRSSTPLKYWLILANGVGIIDADYADNEENEGEIFLQLINLSPFDIQLHKGDKIGQGIIHTYEKTFDDMAIGKRNGGFGSTNTPKKTITNEPYIIDNSTDKIQYIDTNYSYTEGLQSQSANKCSYAEGTSSPLLNIDLSNLEFAVQQMGCSAEEVGEAIKKVTFNLKGYRKSECNG